MLRFYSDLICASGEAKMNHTSYFCYFSIRPTNIILFNLNASPLHQVLECNYIRQAIDLLEGLIPKEDDHKDISGDHLKRLIVFSLMFSLGALLELDDRKKVSLYIIIARTRRLY